MKFLPRSNNGDRTFRLLKHQREDFPIALNLEQCQKINSEWILIEENPSLLILLSKYRMLNLSNYEMQWAKQEIIKMNPPTLEYCKQQAESICKYADDSMYRIATRIFREKDFAFYARRGLPNEIRRFVLALALQTGTVLR